MSGFVTRTFSRGEAIEKIAGLMGFPWVFELSEPIPLEKAIGYPSGEDLISETPNPPFNRSLRDGYAVCSEDLTGTSESSPVFLTLCGEVPMGKLPEFNISRGCAALVHTGGAIPEGADAVVMIEDTSESGSAVEIRKSIQSGENVLIEGEEFLTGQVIVEKGEIFNFRNIGSVASCGFAKVRLVDLKIAVISTGDEIVPVGIPELLPGMIRDSNSSVIMAHLLRAGFRSRFMGIAGDDPGRLGDLFHEALAGNDVVLLSGGSSVSVRDHSVELLRTLGEFEGDVPVRGLNISPGKPTIVSGNASKKKIAVCLPGHPHSCSVICATFLVPLLRSAVRGKQEELFKKIRLPAASDIIGKSGVEEFIPARIDSNGEALPLWGKSGYVMALNSSDGFIRLSEQEETVRCGKKVEVWLW
ncbi:MAG TPA: molybdopterin molybdotransferase MoeA [Thermovirgaceae bacterium]|jgi:molybdopterin molybdotransferase|nr:molybdopterin molybdotransferase MoeA [Thermovirgaceae bacterium]